MFVYLDVLISLSRCSQSSGNMKHKHTCDAIDMTFNMKCLWDADSGSERYSDICQL
jgi:hypothetical protein